MKKLKIFVLLFSLIFCCFGLNGAAKVKNSEKTFSIVLDYYFDKSGMKYSEFKSQKNPVDYSSFEKGVEFLKEENKPTKENVCNVLVFYLVVNAILNYAEKNKLINKISIKQFNESNLVNFFWLPRLIGTTGDVCGLSKKELKWLKNNITIENLRKVEITEETLKKAKDVIVKFMDSKISEILKQGNFKDLVKKMSKEYFKSKGKKIPEFVKNRVFKYYENLDKIKKLVLNAKLEDVKKALSNFKECSVRVTNVDTSKV